MSPSVCNISTGTSTSVLILVVADTTQRSELARQAVDDNTGLSLLPVVRSPPTVSLRYSRAAKEHSHQLLKLVAQIRDVLSPFRGGSDGRRALVCRISGSLTDGIAAKQSPPPPRLAHLRIAYAGPSAPLQLLDAQSTRPQHLGLIL